MNELGVSIVIPTFNRRKRLERVLSALTRQTVSPATFEVVVVDDGSSDGTSEWLSEQRFAFDLRPIRQVNSGPARARNAAVEAARKELLLFLDDDVEPFPELVAEHLAWHAREENVVVIGPLGTLPHYAQPWVAWEQERIDRQYLDMKNGVYAPTFRQFWTGNASVARAHVLAVGGFDNDFLRGEDVELGSRLHLRGLQFRFNPNARTLHHAERSLESWEHAQTSYGRLEVQIFGRLGGEELEETLAWNFSRLHPLTRSVVRRCALRSAYFASAKWTLERALRLEAASPKPLLANRLCSVLANVLYWRASATALGLENMKQIFARGDEIGNRRS